MNVGGDLAKLVPGRVSTEVDARLAYDTHGIIRKVLNFKNEINWLSLFHMSAEVGSNSCDFNASRFMKLECAI